MATACTLESAGVALTVLPERGGKITSLFDRARHREWLVQADEELVGPTNGDAPYDQGDLCGWDEMLPTIAACRYPGTDRDLDDHGELWRMEWTIESRTGSSITMSVVGDLGYVFERRLSLVGERVDVHYRVVASDDGLQFLWAAHPFLALGPKTRLALEGFSEHFEISEDGAHARTDWPDEGMIVRDSLAPGSGRKLFARATAERVRATLSDTKGPSLSWSWSKDDAPWLGLWLDRASLSRHLVAAIEPTNACDDSLDVASQFGHSWLLGPGEARQWDLSLTCGGDPRVEAEDIVR
jgi:galactose mutarotase-like enzyme